MKKFHFTLHSVLTVRRRQEDEATATYAETLLAQRQAVTRLDAVEGELNTSRHEMRGRLNAGCTAAAMTQSLLYHRSIEKRRDVCAADLNIAERRVQAALQAMLSARQQREVVEKFRTKQKSRFDYECADEERKLMDDLVSSRSASPLSWARA